MPKAWANSLFPAETEGPVESTWAPAAALGPLLPHWETDASPVLLPLTGCPGRTQKNEASPGRMGRKELSQLECWEENSLI